MPSRNILKIYVSDSYYHIYNRGVAKQKVFRDRQDYKVFLKYLKEALSIPVIKKIDFNLQGRTFKGIKRPVKNFHHNITLIAYCLMPNHFHLLLKQKSKETIKSFMRSISTRYAAYFNRKYDRIGPLYQGRYKAVLITNDEYLLHLTRYIHLNPAEYISVLTKAYSSYADYLGLRNTLWLNPNFILKFFKSPIMPVVSKFNDYKTFVENNKTDSATILEKLTLD
ncbi:hypothetical protein A2962_00040 [Candidatus Woesebacteria bacterium RIFCSPLOWO2_01_FULL_39_61]|uniref:Transposase IS200-like domain-containing protein n=1 Tax=Candidatus Woesebacteria bacterium RIFCSPHIGHO2_02_FULL_39_13 TaxID=1802505 RepID=A0A1F7Z212_9BACT|nr:MAG: hypothetical protein A3D01_06020 [Candidatus Woesebacteria bacterium RIFCSPHIGHO2_02_FULL_39_13]OGM68124.1 MAG: hypothetical protein A2962_00040 [Candidatus Woesebacteria bacterium RIFCSPLOWO2_01_FULL_39_61]